MRGAEHEEIELVNWFHSGFVRSNSSAESLTQLFRVSNGRGIEVCEKRWADAEAEAELWRRAVETI